MENVILKLQLGQTNNALKTLEQSLPSLQNQLGEQVSIAYWCLFALTNFKRHPEERLIKSARIKDILGWLRYQVFGPIFPDFGFEVSSIRTFLKSQTPKIPTDFWNFLDDLSRFQSPKKIHVSSKELNLPVTYAELAAIVEEGVNFRKILKMLAKEWADVPDVANYYEQALASMTGNAVLQQHVNNQCALNRHFSADQAAFLWRQYEIGRFSAIGLHKSLPFCDVILSHLYKKPWSKSPLSSDYIWMVAEILRKQSEIDLLLDLYRATNKPKFLLTKLYLATAYAYGTDSDKHKSILKDQVNFLIAKGTEGKSFPRLERKNLNQKRIALMTADIGNHAVSYFLSSIFDQFEKHGWELYLFANCELDNERAKNFAEKATETTIIKNETTEDAFSELQRAEPSLILELNGFTSGNRYDLLSRDLGQPVVHYLGGLGSTRGLADYVLTDDVLNPSDHLSQFYSETLVSLDNWMCYSQNVSNLDERLDLITSKPAQLQDRYVIGLFNNLLKIGPKTIRVITSLLYEIENAFLVVAHVSNTRHKFENFLGQIPENLRKKIYYDDRRIDWVAHQRRVSICDIVVDAMDVFSGGTSTCDALAAGTPVLTTHHQRVTHVERMTLSIMTSAGLGEDIVTDLPTAEDALNLSAKYNDRTALINSVGQSPLMDRESHAANLFETLGKLN